MIPARPEWKAPSFKCAEGGEIWSGKNQFTVSHVYSATVLFAHSVAIWKLGNPTVTYSCQDMSVFLFGLPDGWFALRCS